ncbi:MAG: sensor histidine kinase [Gaiellaceae bacterium]
MAAGRREDPTEQILGAEQDERRRIALFLHDGPVQSLAGVALMLDAVLHFVEQDRKDEACEVLRKALERHRLTIGELRDLSFNLEPVILRDQGFAIAVRGLAEQRGLEHGIRMELDVEAADALGERTQAALYQIVRESLDGAIRRGPPQHLSVLVSRTSDGIETVIVDDAPGERRRRSIEVLEERARTLGATLAFVHREDGTSLRIVLPPYAATD